MNNFCKHSKDCTYCPLMRDDCSTCKNHEGIFLTGKKTMINGILNEWGCLNGYWDWFPVDRIKTEKTIDETMNEKYGNSCFTNCPKRGDDSCPLKMGFACENHTGYFSENIRTNIDGEVKEWGCLNGKWDWRKI